MFCFFVCICALFLFHFFSDLQKKGAAVVVFTFLCVGRKKTHEKNKLLPCRSTITKLKKNEILYTKPIKTGQNTLRENAKQNQKDT